jgi:cytochrome c biogenesis factor
MNTYLKKLIELKAWGLFFTIVVLTKFVYLHGWFSDYYDFYLAALAITSVFLAIWILWKKSCTWKSILFITAGLIFGQWWFVEGILVNFIWSITGFS